jgi:molybdopterin converting factor small subunit
MVEVVFAAAFRRHVECPTDAVDGATVGEVLAAYFAAHPPVRSYVIDESGTVRKHVAVFHNDDLVTDRSGLGDRVADGDRIHVFQALSGGST